MFNPEGMAFPFKQEKQGYSLQPAAGYLGN